ncbi:hypothetical protein [Streptomyces sp. H27-C3]|uniref:hypothetical protein n=1 Tax=Streptomyces sp. H27-C3 TaxID=3046305 RepID=UPI0024B90965|nr:hypothetical protein [Streptomyces sp. H27-C3]MDJ0465878.1 hypothetical protein [Streptomyces sp. H27-C3]
MITARPVFSTTRTRHPAGPLRLLWLAALLLAFLYTHAAGADSATAHVTGGAVEVPHLAPADTGEVPHHDGQRPERHDNAGDGGGGHSHPAEACASGHPQQGSDLPGPHLAAVAVRTPAFAAMTPQQWTQIRPCGLPPSHHSLGSVVQQV